MREERLRRKHDPKESKALEEMVAQDQTYIAEMVKIICGTAAPSLKESNGYSRERLLGAAGARQLPMSGFALAALAVLNWIKPHLNIVPMEADETRLTR